MKKQCSYCKRYFKNTHGLHIHHHYCWVKEFVDLPFTEIEPIKIQRYYDSPYFIPIRQYWCTQKVDLVEYAKENEIGIYKGERILVKKKG